MKSMAIGLLLMATDKASGVINNLAGNVSRSTSRLQGVRFIPTGVGNGGQAGQGKTRRGQRFIPAGLESGPE